MGGDRPDAGDEDAMVDVDAAGRTVLRVHVVPGAGRTGIAGRHGDALKVRVAAPPEHGRANGAVLALLAGLLGVPERQLTLVAGRTSRSKRIRVDGLAAAAVVERLRGE